jgi:homoaconitase/3-isopropylmalate dehydratase large subunit
MSLIKDILKENKQTIVDSIFDEELKTKVVKAINTNVDVPFISEKTEAKVIEALYSSVEDVVKETIVSKL